MRLKIKKILPFAALLYMAALLYIVLFTKQRLTNKKILPHHFIPFQGTFESIFQPPKYNTASHYIAFVLNFAGNILLFIPFGIFLSFFLRAHKSYKKIVLLSGFFLSLSVEITQLIFHLGVFDTDDIMLNLLSTWLGILIFGHLKSSNRNPDV